jgi:hypothetical protein
VAEEPIDSTRIGLFDGSMPTAEMMASVDASPESLVAVLLDAESAPMWTAGLEWLELVEGVVGEPGCVGRAHYVEGGRQYTLEDRLVDVVPNRYYKSEIIGGGIKATVETTLEPVEDGTQLTLRWSGTGTNPLTRITLPFMRQRLHRQIETDLDALRRLAERRGTRNNG